MDVRFIMLSYKIQGKKQEQSFFRLFPPRGETKTTDKGARSLVLRIRRSRPPREIRTIKEERAMKKKALSLLLALAMCLSLLPTAALAEEAQAAAPAPEETPVLDEQTTPVPAEGDDDQEAPTEENGISLFAAGEHIHDLCHGAYTCANPSHGNGRHESTTFVTKLSQSEDGTL